MRVITNCQLPYIVKVIRSRRTSLFGHVARMQSGTPARHTLKCAIARRSPVRWTRPIGRPSVVDTADRRRLGSRYLTSTVKATAH